MCGPLRPIGDDASPGEVESRKPGDLLGPPLHYCGRGEGWGGEGQGFSYLLESHMTYLAGSHIHRSWPGIRLRAAQSCNDRHPTWQWTASKCMPMTCWLLLAWIPSRLRSTVDVTPIHSVLLSGCCDPVPVGYRFISMLLVKTFRIYQLCRYTDAVVKCSWTVGWEAPPLPPGWSRQFRPLVLVRVPETMNGRLSCRCPAWGH